MRRAGLLATAELLVFSYVRASFRVRMSDYASVLHQRIYLLSSLALRGETAENRLPYVHPYNTQ